MAHARAEHGVHGRTAYTTIWVTDIFELKIIVDGSAPCISSDEVKRRLQQSLHESYMQYELPELRNKKRKGELSGGNRDTNRNGGDGDGDDEDGNDDGDGDGDDDDGAGETSEANDGMGSDSD